MKRILSTVPPASLFVVELLFCAVVQAAPLTRTVEPKESTELFANPGMGWQTFQKFAHEDRQLAGLPSANAYFRFYWREVEPEPGRIDFAKFDALLARARKAGQQLSFRIMCTGSQQYMDVPPWLKEQGCKGIEFRYEGRQHWVPDFADPLFQETHFRLIRELGQRYDGHPDVDLVDIGTVGLWGEWHMSSTEAVDTGKPVPLPSLEIRHAIIDAWCRAFPKSSKVILIGSDEGMTRASASGYGWRADCLGDMGGFSSKWNHMDHFYRQQIEKTGATNAWKQGPIAFESCWDMRKWKQSGWDIRHIFDYALDCHASYLNNKSAPIPEGTREEIERFLRRIGYRLVLRRLDHPASAKAGAQIPITLTWENVGVAPPYRDYRIAFRLHARNNPESSVVCATDTSIRSWLPGGPRVMEVPLKVPTTLAAGNYELALGVVVPGKETPSVRLAIIGGTPELWYPLSAVSIE